MGVRGFSGFGVLLFGGFIGSSFWRFFNRFRFFCLFLFLGFLCGYLIGVRLMGIWRVDYGLWGTVAWVICLVGRA